MLKTRLGGLDIRRVVVQHFSEPVLAQNVLPTLSLDKMSVLVSHGPRHQVILEEREAPHEAFTGGLPMCCSHRTERLSRGSQRLMRAR